MAVYILNNRKIIRHNGERPDSFFSDEYLISNFRIAQCSFDNNKERTASLLTSDVTYKVFEDSTR